MGGNNEEIFPEKGLDLELGIDSEY